MKTAWLVPPLLLLASAGAVPSPTGTLKVHLEGLSRQSVPREISVRVRPTLEVKGNEKRAWQVDVTCPVRDRELICEVPAGRVDLKLYGAAMAPVYKWGQVVQAGETTDLGTVELRRGATIAGWVHTDGRTVPTHSVLVTLHPQRVGNGMAGLDPKPLRTLKLESNSRPWGFFRFEGVQPGTYAVLASEPDRPTARFGLIEIEGERSFELPEPILLVKPLTINVVLRPEKGPGDQPWGLALHPQPPLSGTPSLKPMIFLRQEREGSAWTASDLAAGDYVLSVYGKQGTQWLEEKIRLEPEKTSFNYQIQSLQISGRVTQGGKPLKAEVLLKSKGARFLFRADEEGKFGGHVPDLGEWQAWISSPGRSPLSLEKPVQIPRKVPWAYFDLRIPDTRLPVQVVDEQGHRVPGARVNVEGEVPNETSTDERGEGELWGLEPGRKILKAFHLDPPREGETMEALVAEGKRRGEKIQPVRLILPRKIDIRGRIKPWFGSAAGAQVVAWPLLDGKRGPMATRTQADEDGDFRLSLPVGAREVDLVVLAAGTALRYTRLDVDPRRLLEVQVEPVGGTLVLEIPDEILEEATKPPDPKAPKSRTVPFLYLLRHWADLQAIPQSPGRLVVPNVEPGTYSLCPGNSPRFRRGKAPDPEGKCVSGALEASGELVLRLPASAEESMSEPRH